MQSAGMLLNSLIEEKSNRVVEVLVSSVRPFDLLAGKIFGAWLVGLTMLVAWGGAAYLVADQNHFIRPGMFAGPNMLWFVYFFVAGYLLFASLYAAVGAMCTSIQDAQSFMFPIVVLIMLPMLSLGPVLQHPDSVLSQVLTYFPFSAPFIATLRLTLSPAAPQWQIAIAAVSVAVGAWVLMWMGGKVFRIAIFMSGKPPKPGEIWRWVREA
jgi:ABC-2 type transport system permease protein